MDERAKSSEDNYEALGRGISAAGKTDGPLRTAGKLLRNAAREIGDLQAPESVVGLPPAAADRTGVPWLGLRASYTAVQSRSDPSDEEGPPDEERSAVADRNASALPDHPADERSHKLRKRVKDLRYQLEFLDVGHHRLGRMIRDLHHLTDLLGDRNDLAVFAEVANNTPVLDQLERAELSAHVERKKRALGSEAASLSARLFEEDADSFVRRVVGWVTELKGAV